MDFLLAVLEQSLIFLPLSLGIFVSYSLGKKTDLTVDGSFVLGAAVFAKLSIWGGIPPFISILIAVFGGTLSGLGAGLIQYKGRVGSLLAGILMTFMLYSVNFQILGRPNVGLLGVERLLNSQLYEGGEILWRLCLWVLLSFLFLGGFFSTRFGLNLRAFGANETLVERLGYKNEFYRCLVPMLTNTLSAYAGVMAAQMNGYADINMGMGMALTGIGSVVVGEIFLQKWVNDRSFQLWMMFCTCTLGVFVYFFFVNLFLLFDINPINLKLFLGLILVFFLRLAPRGGIK